MKYKLLFLPVALLVTVLAPLPASPDTVQIGGTVHEDVYVLEGDNLYYVLLPNYGKVFNVAKDDPQLQHVEFSPDAHRQNLYAEYKQNRKRPAPKQDIEIVSVSLEDYQAPPRSVPISAGSGDDRVEGSLEFTASGVPVLTLKGERKPNLDLRARIFAAAQSRAGAAPPTGQRGFGSRAVQGAGAGGAQATSNIQGLGTGGGGGGGGGAGGGGGGAGFTNISELFSTIDDTTVGEWPNPIAQMF